MNLVIETRTRTPIMPAMQSARERLVPKELLDEMRPERIGGRMKLLRESHDLKPSEMADLLGIERTYWSRFEGGKRAPSDTVNALMVAHFGITLDWLLFNRWEKLPLDLAEKMRRFQAGDAGG